MMERGKEKTEMVGKGREKRSYNARWKKENKKLYVCVMGVCTGTVVYT